MKKKYSYQSEVAKTANALYHSNKAQSLSEAFKMAHKAVKLRTSLKTDIVGFSFIKADGSIRQAKGTLNSNFFAYESKGTERKPNHAIIKYFDLDRNAFRSFRVDRLTA